MEDKTVQTVKTAKRSFVGLVTSEKMDKTIVVTIATKKMDRLYKKYVTRTKKYMAHDENNDAHVGKENLLSFLDRITGKTDSELLEDLSVDFAQHDG